MPYEQIVQDNNKHEVKPAFTPESSTSKQKAHSFERKQREKTPNKELQEKSLEGLSNAARIYNTYLVIREVGLKVDEKIANATDSVKNIYNKNEETIKPLLELVATTPEKKIAIELIKPVLNYKAEESSKRYKEGLKAQEKRRAEADEKIKKIQAIMARLKNTSKKKND